MAKSRFSLSKLSFIKSWVMRPAKLVIILSLWACFFGWVSVMHLWISMLQLPNRWQIISRVAHRLTVVLRFILNIKVTVVGEEGHLQGSGYVIISNHLSYLDGIVLGSIFPVVFTTEGKFKNWPLIGQWSVLIGTIFINRERKNEVRLLVLEMIRKLKQTNILLFPEGDSTNGERMLPFQTVALAAPLRNRSIIVPVTLVYTDIDDEPVSKANRDLIYWYDDMDYLPHFWKLLSLGGIEAIVTIQPNIECFRYEDNSAGRKKLAADCYNRVLGRRDKGDLHREEVDGALERSASTIIGQSTPVIRG
jgi:1-acyl-sn-glycerol-3-phosphate acyltransferase